VWFPMDSAHVPFPLADFVLYPYFITSFSQNEREKDRERERIRLSHQYDYTLNPSSPPSEEGVLGGT
jgi:hypothetical protein